MAAKNQEPKNQDPKKKYKETIVKEIPNYNSKCSAICEEHLEFDFLYFYLVICFLLYFFFGSWHLGFLVLDS